MLRTTPGGVGMRHMKPIFFDPRGGRARITNVCLAAAAVCAVVVACVFTWSVIVSPILPQLPPPERDSTLHGSNENLQPLGFAERQISFTRRRLAQAEAKRTPRLAFLSLTDSGGLTSLHQHASELDAVIPDWLSIGRSGGEVGASHRAMGQPCWHTGAPPVSTPSDLS